MLPRRRRTFSSSETAPLLPETSSNTIETTFNNSEMTSRDRTREFISTVKSMQDRMVNGYMTTHNSKKIMKDQHEWTHFTGLAKKIGSDITNTFAKLEKLTLLAKSRSLFDDKPLEIQELTHIIKQDIGLLNKQIAHLQELAKSRKSGQAKHLQSHSNSVVVSLQSKLATMSNDFKQVLEVRTENLKHQKNRRDQFSQGPVSSMLPALESSVLLADQSSGDYSINMEQLQLLDEQDSYIQSRAEAMQTVESTIVELGVIFQQLAHMVQEQDEMVQRIDANVEDASLNVEAAHSEITRYFQSVTSNRWLMLKVFGVLIIFFIIFVVIAGA